MTWYGWVIVGALAVSALLNVVLIGKPRNPITPAAAVAAIVVNGLLIWGVVMLGVHS